jgi:hypothetical protein
MMPKELGGVVSPELLVYGQSLYLWAPCQYLLTEDFRYNESPSGGCVYPSAECFPAHYFGLVRSRGKGGTHDPEGGLKVRKVDRSFEYMFLEGAPKTPETLLPILSQENHGQRLKALVMLPILPKFREFWGGAKSKFKAVLLLSRLVLVCL